MWLELHTNCHTWWDTNRTPTNWRPVDSDTCGHKDITLASPTCLRKQSEVKRLLMSIQQLVTYAPERYTHSDASLSGILPATAASYPPHSRKYSALLQNLQENKNVFVPLLLKLRRVQELFKDGTWRESIKGSAKKPETPWIASKGRRVAISVGVWAARNCKHGGIPCNRGI